VSVSFVRSTGDVNIAVEDVGPRDARAVVFVHGFAQSRHSFRPLFEGPLARDHRLVAFDLRGHGESDKPAGESPYRDGDLLGDDLHAVIETLGLVRPVVVAWSYGGVVLGEYLRRRGDAALSAVLLAAAAIHVGRSAKAFFGPAMLGNARALLSDDLAVYEAGARAFAAACTAGPIDDSVIEGAVVHMLQVPVHVRRALLSRDADFSDDYARCEVPIVTAHGRADQVVLPLMSEHVGRLVPSSVAVLLDRVGHLPWVEAPESFAEAIRELVAGTR
jgi:non-heme chloroperoxidase